MKTHTLLRNKLIILAVLIIVLFGGILLYRNLNKGDFYKVVDRTKQINKYKKDIKNSREVLGWIKVQNTNIDQAIIYRSNEENLEPLDNSRKYLWRITNDKSLLNKETIFGHNILNLSSNPGVKDENYDAFEDLMSFVYLDVAKDSKYIQYTLNGKTYIYKIFSVYFEDTNNLLLSENTYNLNKKSLNKFIKRYKEKSIYDYDVDVNSNDKIITLYTCTRFYGLDSKYTNFIVNARLVRKDEKITNYSVKTNKNYKKVEKQMKENGDEDEKENS